MKINNDLEYNMGNEYTPLPDEYLQKSGEVQPEGRHNKKTSLKKALYMIVAFSVMTFSVLLPGALTPSPSTGNDGDSGNVTTPGNQNQNTETSDSGHDISGEIPTNPIYPIEDGTSYLTVYNDSFDMSDPDNILKNKVLLTDFIFEQTLAQGMEYAMPAYEPQEGFIFMGWVVYYEKDYETGVRMGMLGDTLTAGNICYIRPEQGSRNIEVHAAWRYDGISNMPCMLNLDANGGKIENENSVTYDAIGPMWSGSYIYLCAYPIPVREGYTFTGWYDNPDCSGPQKSVMQAAAFFNEEVNEDGNIYPNWNSPRTITVYAGWVKN
ncbi:MAG: InlB B-repeat-containing protein [Butyrivibrio sp.]